MRCATRKARRSEPVNQIDNPSADSSVIWSYPNQTFTPAKRSWMGRLPARNLGQMLGRKAVTGTDRACVPQSGSDQLARSARRIASAGTRGCRARCLPCRSVPAPTLAGTLLPQIPTPASVPTAISIALLDGTGWGQVSLLYAIFTGNANRCIGVRWSMKRCNIVIGRDQQSCIRASASSSTIHCGIWMDSCFWLGT